MTWLLGMFVLLPVEVVNLPFNMSMVDMWTVVLLPLVWLSVPRGKQVISLYYTVPMLLILIGSFASTIAAPAPRNGLVVVLKEVFAYIWFITLTLALVRLSGKDFHHILVVWGAVVLIHGLLIVAQFLSPQLWQFTAEYIGRGEGYEIYRPSGVMSNANAAALFQLLGFVPLVLARPARKKGAALGLVLLGTMMATGSMGSVLSFATGTLVALAALGIKGHLKTIAKLLARTAAVGALFGALLFLVISQSARYQMHLQRILLGRAERSSESRFDLWQRGFEVFVENNVFLWGVGPENFRVVDGNDNQLHNDFLAFTVERGLISTLGLGLFAGFAMLRAVNIFLIAERRPGDEARLVVLVLLAAMVAAFVYSLTHQVFHNRQLWMILGLQEAIYFRLMTSASEPEESMAIQNPAGELGSRFALLSRIEKA
ncbi:MAG TPA: O-antigen ligase family protein [Candidatus Binatia bacterium]|nr:O-antigen ligase family protein [Candidatus Binatia bacterium]